MTSAATVSLLRWFRRQLAQPGAFREHLEAAVRADDVAEVRRQLERLEFSADQRHHLDELLEGWERELRKPTPNS